MRFQSLDLQYNGLKRTINFSKKSLIYSSENSVGKSTILRLLFFGVGYPIPGTYGIKFKDVTVTVNFVRDDVSYYTKRTGNYIELYRSNDFLVSRTLNNEDDDWLSYLWGVDSIRVLRNVLGAIYMDQDKGWTLLNRGKVIGNIRFNIRDLLIGLSGDNDVLSEKLALLDDQKKMLRQIRLLIDLAESAFDEQNSNSGFEINADDEPGKKFKNLVLRERVLKNNLRNVTRSLEEQKGLTQYISSLHIMIREKDQDYLVSEKNILRFNENIEYLKQKSAWIQADIENVVGQMAVIKRKLSDQASDLFQSTDIVKKTLADISKIPVDTSLFGARESELMRSIAALNQEVETIFTNNNKLISETRNWVNIFAEKLGVSDVVKDKRYIFTRDLKSISGTVYYKVVFSFKMAYIKVIENHTGLSLPIILDSPSGREVTDRNISTVIDILNKFFATNQIIIASINRYDLDDVVEIDLGDRIFPEDNSTIIEDLTDLPESD